MDAPHVRTVEIEPDGEARVDWRVKVVREGEAILVDGGCRVEGYRSDISRTFVLGRPSPRLPEIFEIVKRAQSAALAAAGPGVPCQAVDAAARAVIEKAVAGCDGVLTVLVPWGADRMASRMAAKSTRRSRP